MSKLSFSRRTSAQDAVEEEINGSKTRRTVRSRNTNPPESEIQKILSNAGLTVVEVIHTGDGSFVKTFNNLGQKTFVEVPKDEDISSTVRSMTHSKTMTGGTTSSTNEEPTEETEMYAEIGIPSLGNSETIKCHLTENGEEVCITTSEERTTYSTVKNQSETYGHTTGDLVPAPVVTLTEIIKNPEAVKIETIKETLQLQKASVQYSFKIINNLVNSTAKLESLFKSLSNVYDTKISEIGEKLAILGKEELLILQQDQTNELLKKHSLIFQNLIYKNFLFGYANSLIYKLSQIQSDLEDNIEDTNKVLQELNVLNGSEMIESLPMTPFKQ